LNGRNIVLTADRSLSTNYRDNMIYGFLAIMPSEKLSKSLYYHIFCPAVDYDHLTGAADLAPLGLRRIESSLMDAFGAKNVITAHCDHLTKAIGPDTKVVGINVMDPLGHGPLTTSINGKIDGKEYTPYTRVMFGLLMKKIMNLKEKYSFKTVLGGSGAWQLQRKEERVQYGIDHVVFGEADGHCADMFNEIMQGNAPDLISVAPNKIVDIPYIKGATCSSAIEAMRGCGRGCDFCDPNLRRKRDFPIERLKEEAMINLKYGHTCIWLMSDEIMLYGCDNRDMYPNRDAIVDLYSSMKSLPNVNWVGAVHVTFSAAVADPKCIQRIKEINNFGPDRWNAVQPGIETGSARLFKKHMPYKSKPYSPEEWPEIVLEGIKVLNDNYLFSLCTTILGLPGETDDDVKDSIDLIKKIEGTASIIAPTLWTDYARPENSLTFDKFSKLQWKLYYLSFKIDLKAISKWIWYTTAHFPPGIRQAAGIFGKLGGMYYLRYIRDMAKRTLGEDPDFD
jgi:radical SAM superfamily enzyme YgiQ (UPF0313 family)